MHMFLHACLHMMLFQQVHRKTEVKAKFILVQKFLESMHKTVCQKVHENTYYEEAWISNYIAQILLTLSVSFISLKLSEVPLYRSSRIKLNGTKIKDNLAID